MKKNKREIPLAILYTIKPYFSKQDDKLEISEGAGLLLIKEKAQCSDYFFEVKDYQNINGTFHLSIAHKPESQNSVNVAAKRISYNDLERHFKSWFSLLKQYDTIDIFDDPILEKNYEEFYNKYKLVDEDADIASFEISRILAIDDYLSQCENKLLEMKHSSEEYEDAEIEELLQDVKEIKKNLTTDTKNKVVQRLSMFWGKTKKMGVSIFKELVVKISVEAVFRVLPM